MPEIISDDIGSFPLPQDADKGEVRRIASRIAAGDAGKEDRDKFLDIVGDMMEKKIASGIMLPNFPQVQDMIDSYASLMRDYSEVDDPYLVQRKHAVVPELFALNAAAKAYFKETGEPLKIRVCVTGPLELYLKVVGGSVQEDLLMNMAKTVSRFVENSILDAAHLKTCVFSIDEPGLGLNPNLAIDADVLADAWDVAMGKAGRRDVEIHLHSVNAVDYVYNAGSINVIGVEYAANEKALDMINLHEIESYDKFLRVGVARTDIARMVPEYAERFGQDLWKTKEFTLLAEKMENPRNIEKRIKKAYALFGERIKYAGPDCGLGSWPGQDAAYMLLKNAADAITEFNKKP